MAVTGMAVTVHLIGERGHVFVRRWDMEMAVSCWILVTQIEDRPFWVLNYKIEVEEAEIIPGKHSDKAVAFGQRPTTAIEYCNRYTRTDTCVRWGMTVTHADIAVINLQPFRFWNGYGT